MRLITAAARVALAFYLTASLALPLTLTAQENAPPPAGQTSGAESAPAADPSIEAAPAEENAMAGAGELHFDATFYVMLALAFLVIAVTIDRIIVISRNRGQDEKLVRYLTEHLVKAGPASNLDDIVTEISQKAYGMTGRVSAAALKGWQYGVDTIRQYANSTIIAERRHLERRLVVLSTLGNNVPFIGLLGTVLGIMKSFRDLALAGGDAGPAVVMVGISEALVATAMGLIVAVPTVIFFNILQKAVKDTVSKSEEIVSLLEAIRLSKNG